jgi:hypothetical protein
MEDLTVGRVLKPPPALKLLCFYVCAKKNIWQYESAVVIFV